VGNILVTGGAGFIGSHLVDRLARDPSNQVIVLDSLRRGSVANLEQAMDRVRFVEGDVRDRAVVEEVTQGVEVVYHLAAQSNVLGAVADLDYSFSTNVAGTFEVLRAAAQAGVRRLVFTSSREVYGDPAQIPVPETAAICPKNAYGASKAAGEMYCRVLSSPAFATVIVRLANVYGPRDFDRVIPIFVGQALDGLPLTLYGGQQTLDFIWIDTVVDCLIAAGRSGFPPGPLNVGSGKPTALLGLAERIVSQTGSRSPLHVAPSREVEVSQFVADTALLSRLFSVKPIEDPLQYLPDVIAFSREKASKTASKTMVRR
jgi:UDP-glucose 4-epimerase